MDGTFFEFYPVISFNSIFEDAKGALADPFVRPGYGGFGIDVVFIRQEPGQIALLKAIRSP